MTHALASLVKVSEPKVSRYEFYVPLCDILLDLVDRDIDDPNALKLSQIAHSLAHDFLNLATLAGRLLWCEGVTPDMSRSPDLVAISVDTESYLMSLRTTYDILTGAIAHFGVEPRDRGKVPKESFNALKNWIEKEEQVRLSMFYGSFRFITQHFDQFMKVKGMRDKLVHQGYHPNIYTDRVLFKLFLMPVGEIELQALHGGYKQEDYQEDRPRFKQLPLLAFLKELTLSVFELANQLTKAIQEQQQLQCSQTHVLSGVYVPALHHLISYEQPIERHLQDHSTERRRHIVAWHLLKAGDYLSSVERGYPDGFWWRFIIRVCELFTKPPIYVSHPSFVGSGALVEWELIFQEGESNFALSLRDSVLLEPIWLQGVKENLDKLAQKAHARRAVLVANSVVSTNNPSACQNDFEYLVIESDPIVAAEKALLALNP